MLQVFFVFLLISLSLIDDYPLHRRRRAARRSARCGPCTDGRSAECSRHFGKLCLSETSSSWQIIANRVMLSPNVGPLPIDLVGARWAA